MNPYGCRSNVGSRVQFYNFESPHVALNGRTRAEASGNRLALKMPLMGAAGSSSQFSSWGSVRREKASRNASYENRASP